MKSRSRLIGCYNWNIFDVLIYCWQVCTMWDLNVGHMWIPRWTDPVLFRASLVSWRGHCVYGWAPVFTNGWHYLSGHHCHSDSNYGKAYDGPALIWRPRLSHWHPLGILIYMMAWHWFGNHGSYSKDNLSKRSCQVGKLWGGGGGGGPCPNIVTFSPLKDMITVFLWSIIENDNERVVNFHSVHWRDLLRIPTRVCLYLIYSGQGLCWCRVINATNDPEFMTYKLVLGTLDDRYIVGNVQMSTIYL